MRFGFNEARLIVHGAAEVRVFRYLCASVPIRFLNKERRYLQPRTRPRRSEVATTFLSAAIYFA